MGHLESTRREVLGRFCREQRVPPWKWISQQSPLHLWYCRSRNKCGCELNDISAAGESMHYVRTNRGQWQMLPCSALTTSWGVTQCISCNFCSFGPFIDVSIPSCLPMCANREMVISVTLSWQLHWCLCFLDACQSCIQSGRM